MMEWRTKRGYEILLIYLYLVELSIRIQPVGSDSYNSYFFMDWISKISVQLIFGTTRIVRFYTCNTDSTHMGHMLDRITFFF